MSKSGVAPQDWLRPAGQVEKKFMHIMLATQLGPFPNDKPPSALLVQVQGTSVLNQLGFHVTVM